MIKFIKNDVDFKCQKWLIFENIDNVKVNLLFQKQKGALSASHSKVKKDLVFDFIKNFTACECHMVLLSYYNSMCSGQRSLLQA